MLRGLIDRAIAGPARVRGPRVGQPTLAEWNVRVGQWLAMGRVGQDTEVEENGVIVLAASLFKKEGGSYPQKEDARSSGGHRLDPTALYRPAHTRRHGGARM